MPRAHALALTGTFDHRRFPALRPRLAVHRVSPETVLIPQEDVSVIAPGLFCNGAKGLALPAFDRYRIALIGMNRKAIFNRDMVPNISLNSRGRKRPKRGRKPRFDPAIFEEWFRTIERLFAWEDTH
jgi:hypothetical protein